MYLESTVEQRIEMEGHELHFAAHERICTEYSCKYHVEEFQHVAAKAGFEAIECWLDERSYFSIQLFRAD